MAQKKEALPAQAEGCLMDDETFFQEVIREFCQRFLEGEMATFLQAEPYARTRERKGYRNGYKPRTLKTRVGRIELLVPQDRQGQFQSELFGRYQRNEKALVLALQESYLQGVSTRNVQEITEKLCGTSFSKSLVSKLCQELDADIEAWRHRPLRGSYPYVSIDAHCEYVRDQGRVVSKSTLIVKGISKETSRREILAVEIGDSESEATWSEVFRKLRDRGLSGVLCVTSDDHRGLVAAQRRYFPGTSWQRCQTHFQRNVRGLLPPKEQKAAAEGLREVFNAPTLEEARLRVGGLLDRYQQTHPKVAEFLDLEIEHTLTCFHFPKAHRVRIRTNNGLERFHEEVNRRSNVIRIFPNDAACIRLVAALAMEQSEEWLTGRRYLDMSLLDEATLPSGVLNAAD